MIDFTNCKRLFGKAYSGANGKKIGIEYRGEPYMLKFPPSGKEKPTELSYTNGCISEHLGSSIFNLIGIPAQETILGFYTLDGKEKIVCACKDFTVGGKRLLDFCSIKNTVLESDSNGTGTELAEIEDALQLQHFIDPVQLTEHFWNMFVVDALLGNFDRHNGNWGFLIDAIEQNAEIAPIFDCGSCLLPQADEKVMRSVFQNEDQLNARIYQFPTSAIKIRDRKVNYYDFLMNANHPGCNDALQRIVPRVDMDAIDLLIDETEILTDLQKDFYKTYIDARFQKILLPAYEQVESQEPNLQM
ncbi:MAG: HipA domain-containing protein [Clostridia bacterium]|nr:HipA domain-containing protein [Clostridia bacterium]